MNKEIIALRQELHKHPELSNKEFETSKRIKSFMSKLKPDEEINLGKTGLAFVFNGKKEGKTTMFRSELDALPIAEKNDLEYISVNKDIAHSCGHDGHMAIICGLAQKIANNRPEKGKIVLLFQHAEEMEQGAKDVVNHPAFKQIEPDYIFALHNIPGVEKHKILLKKGSFASASKGMTIKLFGQTSHAAEPEKGINPSTAISEIISKLHDLRDNKVIFSDLALLTFINIQLGEAAFGTSPGYAEIRITLRAFENKDLDILTKISEKIISDITTKENLDYEIDYSEEFPSTVNNTECCELIKKATKANNNRIEIIDKAFRWSEDFGYFTEKYKGGFFGLGSGVNQAALHNSEFNFPDEIIDTGVDMFYDICKQINLG